MKVQLRVQVSGMRDGQPWPPAGGVIDVPDDEALTLLRNGTADPVVDFEAGVELRDVVIESDGRVDTSARDALVPSSTKRTRERNRP